MVRRRSVLLILAAAPLVLGQSRAGLPAVQLAPSSGQTGQTLAVIASGYNFHPSGKVSFEPPGSIDSVVVRKVSDLQLLLQLQISPQASGVYALVYTPPPAPAALAPVALRFPNAFRVVGRVAPTPAPGGGSILALATRAPTGSPTPAGGAFRAASPTATPPGPSRLSTSTPTRPPRVTHTPSPTPTSVLRLTPVTPTPTPSHLRVTRSATPTAPTPSATPTAPSRFATPSATETRAFTPSRTTTVTPSPTPSLLKPQVDEVHPAMLARGGEFQLQITGRNLSPGTRFDFGDGITVVGVPLVTSPTSAEAQILVSATAAATTREVGASNERGRTLGPGAVLIGVAPPPTPKPQTTPPPLGKPKFHQPHGNILLDFPCDPDALFSTTCHEPPLLTDATLFVWHEETFGLAKYFVFEIVDGSGKVLASAQTSKPYFRMTAPLLASLPKLGAPTAVAAGLPPGQTPLAAGPIVVAGAKSSQDLVKAQSQALATAAKGKAGSEGFQLIPLVVLDRPKATGEVAWRVRGLGNAIDEATGMVTSQLIEVERSAQRAIRLPLPSNGFSCEGGSKLGTLVGHGDPFAMAFLGPRPKPCEGNSTNICSTVDFAEIPETARLDLSRVPFPLHAVGDLKTSSQVTFQNVLVDWGDGSEPEPLTVDGGAGQSLKSLRLARKGTPDWKRLRHRYINGDKAAEFVDYTIRIFSLADQDKTPEILIAMLDAMQASKSSSTPKGGKPLTQSPAVVKAAFTPGDAGSAAGEAGLTNANASKVVEALASGMFTIACAPARVYNPLGAGADDPLKLLEVEVVFPTDPAGAPPGKLPVKNVASKPAAGGKAPPGASAKAPVDPLAAFGPVAEVSDCSSAFKASARITYWGHGRVRLSWYVDDELVETQEPPAELPPVSIADGEAGTRPWTIEMDGTLPATVALGSHKVRVRVEGGGPKTAASGTQFGGSPLQLAPGGPVGLGPGRSAPGGAPVTLPPGAEKLVAGGATFASGGDTDLGPHTEVQSKDRYYTVFDHTTKGLPCRLRYKTEKSGVLEITDFQTFTKSGEGDAATYTASGMLNLILPSLAGDADSVQPVPVSFSGWKLGPSPEGGEDVLDVLAGTLDQTLSAQKKAANFPLKITRIRLTPQEATLDGDVAVGTDMGLKAAAASQLPRWEFVNVPLDPGGGLVFAKAKAVKASIGASQFLLDIGSAEVDLSRSQGGPSAERCGGDDPGVQWLGVRLDGTLRTPGTLQLGGGKLLADRPFEDWGLTPGGLDVKDSDSGYEKTLAAAAVKITAKGFHLSACGGSFSASFGVQIANAPLVLETITGILSIDEQAAVHAFFPPLQIQHDWGTVKAKITHAEFSHQQALGAWGVEIDSHLQFFAGGAPVFEADYSGLLAALDGTLTGPGGKTYFAAGGGQTASLAGFPLQVTQLGAGSESNGDLWLGFRGDLEVGVNAPTAEDREIKFPLRKVGSNASSRGRDGFLLASYRSGGAPPPPPSGYAPPAGGNELDVQPAHLEFFYPPSEKFVHVVVDAVWEKGPAGYRFHGNGNVQIADSFGIESTVLFGRQKAESFWMVRAAYTFPVPLPLGSTPLGLTTIGGGLGYNITAASYEKSDVKQVSIDGSKDYSFSAAAEVSDVGLMGNPGFALFLRGRLTIKLGDGLRLNVKAWLLSDGHSDGTQMGEGCVQYMSGAFDAGFAMKVSLGAGAVWVEAPGGADVCTTSAVNIHFGNGADWHIWIGTEENPIAAHILVVDNQGWLTIDGNGVKAGLKASADKKFCLDFEVCDACAWFGWGYKLEVGLFFHPFNVSGGVGGNVGCGIDVCGVGMSVDGSANLTVSINPVEVCGSVGLTVHTPNWLPNVHFSRSICLP